MYLCVTSFKYSGTVTARKENVAILFFDAQARCLAYMKWVFEILCAVKEDYGANYMPNSAELLGILSLHIIAHRKPTLQESHYEEQFDSVMMFRSKHPLFADFFVKFRNFFFL